MNRIRQLREEFGITQSDLSKRLNVQAAAISKYETERVHLTEETIKKLSNYFGVSADYLLGNSDIRDETILNDPNAITRKIKNVLEIYRKYLDIGYSEDIRTQLELLIPEIAQGKLSRQEEKILDTFRKLNEDNQDILIGKSKEMLRDQNSTYDSVAAEGLRKVSGK
jgi:transcriptional regulator with XRE-family HTH domain